MKLSAILPALTVLAGTIGAQTPDPKPGSIDGVVTNSVTHEPVKKATVSILLPQTRKANPSTQTAITDAAGHFHFDSVAPGSYRLTANCDGFVRDAADPTRPGAQLTVAEEQQIKDAALKLMPVATISGHILDEDGDPIVRAQVAVMRYYYGQARKAFNQISSAESNDLGEFEAINLPPGHYYVEVSVPPRQSIPPHT